MEENRTPETGRPQDFRRVRSANGGLLFRLLGIFVVLYWLYEIIAGYLQGGPDAPTLGVLITGCMVLGGGAILVGWLTWKAWKLEKANAVMTDEEVAQMEALREDHEDSPKQ